MRVFVIKNGVQKQANVRFSCPFCSVYFSDYMPGDGCECGAYVSRIDGGKSLKEKVEGE